LKPNVGQHLTLFSQHFIGANVGRANQITAQMKNCCQLSVRPTTTNLLNLVTAATTTTTTTTSS
jgi:hypothetical protein